MSIDAKDIQIFVCRAVKFSVNIFSSFVQKYPVVSCVVSFLILLYFFFPSVFYFLLYSLPFVVCTVVFIYFYFISKRPGSQNVETHRVRQALFEKPEADAVVVNRDVNFCVQTRNVKDIDVQGSSETQVAKSLTDDLTRENFLIEEKSRVAAKDIGKSSCQNYHVGESSSVIRTGSGANRVDQASKSQGGGEVEIGSSSSGEDEDEEGKEGTNKAVEWSEDDQKNLMDLGFSELERNKRLESLIARRRARKSKNPIQKSINMNNAHPIASVAHVLIARTNPFDIPSSSNEPTPGSAPSVLLQTRNPFDLPYDPLEEKPDLTADSFLQEFMPAHQKDMFFCRHESFLLGPSFPVLDCIQDQHEGLGFPRVKRTPNNSDHDRVAGDTLFSGGEQPLRRTLSVTDLVTEGESFEQALNKAEVSDEGINDEKVEHINGMKLDLASGNEIQKEAKTTGSSSSGSDVDDDQEAIFNGNTIGITENIHVTGFEFPETIHKPGHTPLPCPVPKCRVIGDPTYDSLPSPNDKSRAEELSFLGTKAPWHTPSNSIASDMQVEVSELGSPPLTADGTGSSNDGDSLTYQADVDKEVTSGSDEIWEGLPCETKLDQDQLNSKQEYEASEDEATREQLFYIQKELDNPVASFMQSLPFSTTEEPSEVHRVLEAVGDKTSNSSNKVEVNNSSEGNLLLTKPIDPELDEKPQESVNLSDNSSKGVMENSGLENMKPDEVGIHGNERSFNEKFLTRDELADLSKLAEESRPESMNAAEHESLSCPEKTEDEGGIIHTKNESAHNVNDQIEDLISKENHNVTTGKSDKQGTIADLSETTQDRTSEFIKPVENNSGEPENNPTTLLSTMPAECDDNQNIPSPLEGENFSLSHHDDEEQESHSEVAVSGLSQTPNNSTTQLDLLGEQVSTNSSTSDSPISVFPDISPRDQIPPSVFNQQMEMPVLESNQESEVRNGLTDSHVHENAGFDSPKSTQDEIDTSIHQPNISGSETSEEPHDNLDNSISEANDTNIMNKTVFDDEKEDSRLNETSNVEFTSKSSELPAETNTISAEQIERSLVANPADIGEEVLNCVLEQNPTAQAEITYNADEPLAGETTTDEKQTSPENFVDDNHDSNTSKKPEEITERSEASEIANSEPTKDAQGTINHSKKDAVNDFPSLLVDESNNSTDRTINSEDGNILQNEIDADKSGEANDS